MQVKLLAGRNAGRITDMPYAVAAKLIATGMAVDLRNRLMQVKYATGPQAGLVEDIPQHAAEALIATGQASLFVPTPVAETSTEDVKSDDTVPGDVPVMTTGGVKGEEPADAEPDEDTEDDHKDPHKRTRKVTHKKGK